MMETDDPLMAPYFFSTDAHQTILGIDGITTAEDYGYGLHFDEWYFTTWGCIRLGTADIALWLAQQVNSLPPYAVGIQVL